MPRGRPKEFVREEALAAALGTFWEHGYAATGLADLTETLPGAQGFKGGRSESPEQIERGYMHGFTVDFDDWDALQTYADNPDHKALGAQLVENAVGGIDGILVLDINV